MRACRHLCRMEDPACRRTVSNKLINDFVITVHYVKPCLELNLTDRGVVDFVQNAEEGLDEGISELGAVLQGDLSGIDL